MRTCSGCKRPTRAELRPLAPADIMATGRAAVVILTCDHCDRRVCDRCGMPDPTGKRARCGACGGLYPALVRNLFCTMGLQPWE